MTLVGTLFVCWQRYAEWRRRERAQAQFEETLELWDVPRGAPVRNAE